MKNFITMLAVCVVFTAHAQTKVVKDASGNYSIARHDTVREDHPTGHTLIDADGKEPSGVYFVPWQAVLETHEQKRQRVSLLFERLRIDSDLCFGSSVVATFGSKSRCQYSHRLKLSNMSHFTVLVIGNEPEKQLQPYHEYECTGIHDEYVEFVPAEEDLIAEWEASDKSEYPTVESYAKDYYGYEQENGVFGRLTNPNSKWDWYQLGGRWTGMFHLKLGVSGKTGKPGLMTEPAPRGKADQALKRDIDFEFMRQEAILKASQQYDYVAKIIDGTAPNKSWKEILEANPDREEAREIYNAQERVISWDEAQKTDGKAWPFGIFTNVEDFNVPRDLYLKDASDSAITTFALLKDGKWYEKGEMGWFACVSNAKDEDVWNAEFNKMLDTLPEDTLLSVYDCHI